MEPQEIHITSHDLMHTGIFNTIIIQVLRWMAEILIGAHEFTTVSRREANAGHPDNPVTGRTSRYRPMPVFFNGNYTLLPSECMIKVIRQEGERRGCEGMYGTCACMTYTRKQGEMFRPVSYREDTFSAVDRHLR